MKKNMKKNMKLVAAAAAFSLAMSVSAFAAGWQQGSGGRWWYSKDAGAVSAKDWNWRKDSSGQWYQGQDKLASDNTYCANGWWWILDASANVMKCYYFDANGYMFANGTAPDGSQVNEKGEWCVNGVPQDIVPPAPYTAMRADFDSTPYRTENYAGSTQARLQKTGWQKDENGWWYKRAGSRFCANGWWWIFDSSVQGLKCYYFNAQGYMLANTNAPDGSHLNAQGEWTSNGVVQVRKPLSATDVLTDAEYQQAVRKQEQADARDDDDDYDYDTSSNNSSSENTGENTSSNTSSDNTSSKSNEDKSESAQNSQLGQEDSQEKQESSGSGQEENKQENAGGSVEQTGNEEAAQDEKKELVEMDDGEWSYQTNVKYGWFQDTYGWCYRQADGSLCKDGWWWIDADQNGATDGIANCYFFRDYAVYNTDLYFGKSAGVQIDKSTGARLEGGTTKNVEAGGVEMRTRAEEIALFETWLNSYLQENLADYAFVYYNHDEGVSLKIAPEQGSEASRIISTINVNYNYYRDENPFPNRETIQWFNKAYDSWKAAYGEISKAEESYIYQGGGFVEKRWEKNYGRAYEIDMDVRTKIKDGERLAEFEHGGKSWVFNMAR